MRVTVSFRVVTRVRLHVGVVSFVLFSFLGFPAEVFLLFFFFDFAYQFACVKGGALKLL